MSCRHCRRVAFATGMLGVCGMLRDYGRGCWDRSISSVGGSASVMVIALYFNLAFGSVGKVLWVKI